MPKYIIERDIPNAGALSAQELQGISQKSCGVLSDMGQRFNGWKAMSLMTRSIVFILPLTKQRSRNTLKKADFRRIVFLK